VLIGAAGGGYDGWRVFTRSGWSEVSMASSSDPSLLLQSSLRGRLDDWLRAGLGYVLLSACVAGAVSLLTWSIADPSFTRAASGPTRNALGPIGANFADLAMRLFGLAGVFIVLPPTFWALQLITRQRLDSWRLKLTLAPVAVLVLAGAASSLPNVAVWPLPNGLGGLLGDQVARLLSGVLALAGSQGAAPAAGATCFAGGMILLIASLGLSPRDLKLVCRGRGRLGFQFIARAWRRLRSAWDRRGRVPPVRREPTLGIPPFVSGRIAASRTEPRFDWVLPMASAPSPVAAHEDLNVPPWQDKEFDGVTDRTCHAMAQRFAPNLEAPPRSMASRLPSRRAGGPASGAETGSGVEGPIWPGSVPRAAERRSIELSGRYRQGRRGDDKLYGRAVAIVRADRKASADHLQERLGIRFMCAADLIERMEQDGILGAPVSHGVRPILERGRPSRVV